MAPRTNAVPPKGMLNGGATKVAKSRTRHGATRKLRAGAAAAQHLGQTRGGPFGAFVDYSRQTVRMPPFSKRRIFHMGGVM